MISIKFEVHNVLYHISIAQLEIWKREKKKKIISTKRIDINVLQAQNAFLPQPNSQKFPRTTKNGRKRRAGFWFNYGSWRFVSKREWSPEVWGGLIREEAIQRILDKWVFLVVVDSDAGHGGSCCSSGRRNGDCEWTGGGVGEIWRLRKREWEPQWNHCV